MIKIFMEPVRTQYPMIFKCPLLGKLEIQNVTLDPKMMIVFPSGIYRIAVNAFNNEDSEVAIVSLLIKLEG